MAHVPYTADEYFDMLSCLIEAERNSRRAAALYQERYEGLRFSDQKVFDRLVGRLMNNGPLVPGAFVPARQGRRIYGVEPELEFLVMSQFAANPNLSTRVCALRLGLNKSRNRLVHRILKANGMYPYKYQKVQALLFQDFQRRIKFCNFILHRSIQNPNFFSYILWTDECTFTPNGMFNSKNYVKWRDENPFNVRATEHQHRWSINIWAGIIGDHLVIMTLQSSK